MPPKKYGSATAQDLYRLFIRPDVLGFYEHWELVDDDDSQDPVPDEWYVVVDLGNPGYDQERRRLDAARLWMAILACASNQLQVRLEVAQKCQQIIYERPIEKIDITPSEADTVMQVALLGQVVY